MVEAMTLDEFLAMPDGISIEEYQKHLETEKKISKALYRISIQIQECEDALKILSDEEGSSRWNKWNAKLNKLQKKQKGLLEVYHEA